MLNLKVAGLMLTGVMALGGIGYGVSQTPAVAAAIETPAGTITQTLVHFGGLNFGSERPGFLDQETMDKEIADALGMTQPGASKHLRVLREVGLVHARSEGKQRLYGLDARGLRPIHAWTGGFEEFWNESLDRLNTYVKELQRKEQRDDAD